jgi:hypothetical protein
MLAHFISMIILLPENHICKYRKEEKAMHGMKDDYDPFFPEDHSSNDDQTDAYQLAVEPEPLNTYKQ